MRFIHQTLPAPTLISPGRLSHKLLAQGEARRGKIPVVFDRGTTPAAGMQRRLSPRAARPPDCVHRSTFVLGGRAVYTTHRQGGYPFLDVASLRVQLGQLTRPDLHQLDCSLVGCSLPPPAPRQMASLRAPARTRWSRQPRGGPTPSPRCAGRFGYPLSFW